MIQSIATIGGNARTLVAALVLAAVLATGGCTNISIDARISAANKVAAANGFSSLPIRTDRFTLQSYTRIRNPGDPLVVFIEGDGLAYLTRNQISGDPTPRETLVLELAAMSRATNVAYLARPCQFIMTPSCNDLYWSTSRFAEEVIASADQAIRQLQTTARAPSVHLVGYSGGGAVAALVAERRTDVLSLRTIAGNLDHNGLNRYHKVTLMPRSLDAIDNAAKLRGLPQIHYAGSKDDIVLPFLVEGFVRRVNDPRCVTMTTVAGATHSDGWREEWRQVGDRIPACK